MKSILLFALACVLVEGTVDPCPQTDHLYYDKSCCDGATQNCLDGILQTDKDAINNLVDLKRADGSACTADDALKYSIDEAANFSGVVCADSGPPVNCVGTWGSYGACANGAKSRSYNASTPASGGGTACPASPESAACNGTIGDACAQASHCASAFCDAGTSKCVAAPTFTLVTDNSNFNVNDPKLIDNENDCMALQPDAALLTALVAYESTFAWATDPNDPQAAQYGTLGAGACASYPKGCSVRISSKKIYWSAGLAADGTACGTTSPISSTAANSKVPVLLP
jgi:hypothetical protein